MPHDENDVLANLFHLGAAIKIESVAALNDGVVSILGDGLLSAEGADRWYRCFYHNLRVRMDEYYHDKAVMERVLNDRREGCYGEADEV